MVCNTKYQQKAYIIIMYIKINVNIVANVGPSGDGALFVRLIKSLWLHNNLPVTMDTRTH